MRLDLLRLGQLARGGAGACWGWRGLVKEIEGVAGLGLAVVEAEAAVAAVAVAVVGVVEGRWKLWCGSRRRSWVSYDDSLEWAAMGQCRLWEVHIRGWQDVKSGSCRGEGTCAWKRCEGQGGERAGSRG